MVENLVDLTAFVKADSKAVLRDVYWAELRAACWVALMVVQLATLAVRKECLTEYYWVVAMARRRVVYWVDNLVATLETLSV